MSNIKAYICSILLLIVIFTLLFATTFVEIGNDITLYRLAIAIMTGTWIGDKVGDFYIWLKNK